MKHPILERLWLFSLDVVCIVAALFCVSAAWPKMTYFFAPLALAVIVSYLIYGRLRRASSVERDTDNFNS